MFQEFVTLGNLCEEKLKKDFMEFNNREVRMKKKIPSNTANTRWQFVMPSGELQGVCVWW